MRCKITAIVLHDCRIMKCRYTLAGCESICLFFFLFITELLNFVFGKVRLGWSWEDMVEVAAQDQFYFLSDFPVSGAEQNNVTGELLWVFRSGSAVRVDPTGIQIACSRIERSRATFSVIYCCQRFLHFFLCEIVMGKISRCVFRFFFCFYRRDLFKCRVLLYIFAANSEYRRYQIVSKLRLWRLTSVRFGSNIELILIGYRSDQAETFELVQWIVRLLIRFWPFERASPVFNIAWNPSS